MKKIKFNEILDLQGVPCPQNSARSLMTLAGMEEGQSLKIIIDDGEPVMNVALSLEDGGYEIREMIKMPGNLWHIHVIVK